MEAYLQKKKSKHKDKKDKVIITVIILNFVLLNLDLSNFEHTVDPDQLASNEASLSGSTIGSLCLKMLTYGLLQVNRIKIV